MGQAIFEQLYIQTCSPCRSLDGGPPRTSYSDEPLSRASALLSLMYWIHFTIDRVSRIPSAALVYIPSI